MKKIIAKTTAICLVLCLMLTVWCSVFPAAAASNGNAVMVDTDFESGVPDTIWANTGTLAVEKVDDAHGQSIKIAKSQQARLSNTQKGAPIYVFEAEVYPLSTSKCGLNFVLETGWTDGPMFESGKFLAKDGGSVKDLNTTYQANTWYSTKLVINYNTRKYDFYVGKSGEDMTCIAKGFTLNTSLTDFQRVILSAWGNDFCVDNVRFTACEDSEIGIRITSPTSGANVYSGRPITIQAESESQSGSSAKAERVDFYVNGMAAGSCYQAPYKIDYVPQGNEDLYIYAEVIDNIGLKSRSEPVTVSVTYTGEASHEWVSMIDADFNGGAIPSSIYPFRDTDGTIECVDSAEDGHGKVLKVARNGSATPYLILNAGEPGTRYVLEADFRVGSQYGVSTNFVSKDGNTKVNGFNIESGYIGLPNGSSNKKLKAVTPGTWYSLRFEFDILNSVYSLYVDGEAAAVDFAFPAEVKDFSTFRIFCWKAGGEYAVDNVKLCKIDTARYNSEFIDTDFSDGVPENIKMIKNDGTITLLDGSAGKEFVDEAHGAALKVAHGSSGTAPYIQIERPSGCTDTGYVMEADIYLGEGYGVSTNLVGDNNAKPEGFYIENKKAGVSGYGGGNYAVDTNNWYHVRFAFDLESKTCDFYVDGNMVVEGQSIKNGESAYYYMRIFNWQKNGFYVIDNITFKTKTDSARLAELSLTDENGNAVSQVKEGNIRAKALLCNDTDEAVSAVMIVAVYEDEMLKDIELSKESVIQPGENESLSALVNICGNADNQTLKVFVWKNKTELVPFDGTMIHLAAQ